MMRKRKNIISALILIACILTGYLVWIASLPVKIIAVHKNENYSSILVKNLPFTDKGKINWWLKNKDILKSKYGIPQPAPNGGYNVTFWDFGGGYKVEGKYDRLCFDDMKPPVNCIDKNAIFSIENSPNLGTIFTIYNGDDYRLDNDGKIIEVNRE